MTVDHRIRHVKCDETKPECLKCKSTGRRCDRYIETMELDNNTVPNPEVLDVKSQSSLAIRINIRFDSNFKTQNPFLLRNSLLNFSGTKLERRQLDFFYSQTAPSVAGHFDTEFWCIIIPQIACSEHSVRHAMIALASLHENCDLENTSVGDPAGENDRFAIRQYNKAIKHLKKDQPPSHQNTLVLLTTCVLFICFECLRGDLQQALTHIASGTLILKSQQVTPMTSASSESIKTQLIEIFSRLNIQAKLNGRKLPSLQHDLTYITPNEAYEPFSTLMEARNTLNGIMGSGLRFIDSALAFTTRPDSDSPERLAATQSEILSQLKLWRMKLDLSTFSDSSSYSKVETLRVSHISATIWTTTAMSPKESTWDTQLPRFVELITLCRFIIGSVDETARKGPYSVVGLPRASRKRSMWRHSFTLDIGVIPHLYLTAIKCRNPKIRREAVRLLGLTRPRKEGLWDARVLIGVAHNVMKIEEGGMSQGELPAEEEADTHDRSSIYVKDATRS